MNRRKAERNAEIARLCQSGVTQTEVARRFELTQGRVAQLLGAMARGVVENRRAARDAEIRRLRAAGATRRELAARFGISMDSVARIAPLPPGMADAEARRWAERNAEIVRLSEAGMGRAEVAQRFGINHRSVSRIVLAAGGTRRPQGPKPRAAREGFPLQSAGAE